MIDVTAIAALASQGFTVLVLPDGSMEVKCAPDARSAAAKRQAAYRARVASQRVTKHNETSQSITSDAVVTTPLPLSPSLPLSPQTPLSPAHPHAPTPAPAHTPARTREADETLTLTADPTPAKPSRKALMADDAAWLAELAKNPAYRGLNLETELGKMQAWCQLKGKTPSRARFLNWINGASTTERPMQTGRPPPNRHGAYTPERAHAKLAGRDPQDF